LPAGFLSATHAALIESHAAAVMVENMPVNDAEEEIALFIEKCDPSWTESWP
jgi:hypothetical protein